MLCQWVMPAWRGGVRRLVAGIGGCRGWMGWDGARLGGCRARVVVQAGGGSPLGAVGCVGEYCAVCGAQCAVHLASGAWVDPARDWQQAAGGLGEVAVGFVG